MDLFKYPPPWIGWLRKVLVTSRPRRISSSTVRARSLLSGVSRCVSRQRSCRSVCICEVLFTCLLLYIGNIRLEFLLDFIHVLVLEHGCMESALHLAASGPSSCTFVVAESDRYGAG